MRLALYRTEQSKEPRSRVATLCIQSTSKYRYIIIIAQSTKGKVVKRHFPSYIHVERRAGIIDQKQVSGIHYHLQLVLYLKFFIEMFIHQPH